MSITGRSLIRWLLPVLATVLGALLTTAAAEAWSLPGRVTVLETDRATDHEMLQEVRQDVKELLRRQP